MNVEIAKELQKYGFPQNVEGIWDEKEDVRIPSLESLIEVLGYELVSLTRIETGWHAKPNSSRYGGVAFTPGEAVARLWLALNSGK